MTQTNRSDQDPSLCLFLQGQLTESEEHTVEKHSLVLFLSGKGKEQGWGEREESEQLGERTRMTEKNQGGEMSLGLKYQGDQSEDKDQGERAPGWIKEADARRRGSEGKK